VTSVPPRTVGAREHHPPNAHPAMPHPAQPAVSAARSSSTAVAAAPERDK
jgi:hypothetical protein